MAEESSNKRIRASGEVLEYLLREFDKNQNPTPDQRKEISERTNMSEKAVRIWFQNRRAKLRKFERMGKPIKGQNGVSKNNAALSTFSTNLSSSIHSSRSNSYSSMSALHMQSISAVEVNEKYCFIDCSSLSVGSWQRIKSGSHDVKLQQLLVNLAPFTLNGVMKNVDLMVILSRKNEEINYFFLAISNNSRILFRIFYPISSVLQCSLLDNNINKENNELRLSLARKPRFSVFFFDSVNSNLNQWSICDDFSEGQQVSGAYYAPGGTSTPHVLVGPKHALLYLKSFIAEHNLIHHLQAALQNYSNPSDVSLQHDPAMTSDYQLAALSSNQYLLEDRSEVHGDLQIKHESWNSLAHNENELTTHETRPPFEAHPLFQHLAHQSNQHDDSILTTTPDFFSAVQSPGSNVVSASTNNDDDGSSGLLPSPSNHMNTNGNGSRGRLQDESDTHGSSGSEGQQKTSKYPQPSKILEDYRTQSQHQPSFDDHHHNAHGHEAQTDNLYDFDINLAGHNDDFQPNDLLVHSPELSNHETPGASTTAANPVDTFIDYNSHY